MNGDAAIRLSGGAGARFRARGMVDVLNPAHAGDIEATAAILSV